MTNGAAGIVISTPEGERHKFSNPTGKYCTSYAAVVQALVYGIDKAEQHRGECQQVAIFTDAKSVLEARAGDKLPDLTRKLKKLSQCHRVALQWIPANCKNLGNEEVDKMAKEGASETQYENSVTLQE